MTKDSTEREINILRQNARTVVRELGLLNDAYFEVGVTLAERHLLIELSSSQEPLTARDIAERLLLDKSTVSRLVARALKKGFITYSIDEKDRRKRFLKFTQLGQNTLHTFEPIAFNQTKNALETLSPQEAKLVQQGMALYARGLKNARLGNFSISQAKIESIYEIHKQLNQLGYTLEPYRQDDEEALLAIFKEVVDTGKQFPYESSSKEEFHAQFFAPTSQVYVCRSAQGQVIGGFYLKRNYSGRSKHIANADYMMKGTHRGCGIGTLIVKASLHLAKNLAFTAMQFNMIFSQNTGAIKLYERLGFQSIGTIPSAIRNPDGSFQDGLVMHRKLDDL